MWALKMAISRRILLSLRLFLASAALALGVTPCLAAVEIAFYSHEFGDNFPHAFVTLEGVDDRTGERIKTDYGFTATQITPAILLGSVKGEVMSLDPKLDAKYLKTSDRHFSVTMTDAEYDSVMATVERWRALKQPSYNLNRQNCVFFVAHIAAAIGMEADTPKSLMKKPRSYLQALAAANREWLAARSRLQDGNHSAPIAPAVEPAPPPSSPGTQDR